MFLWTRGVLRAGTIAGCFVMLEGMLLIRGHLRAADGKCQCGRLIRLPTGE